MEIGIGISLANPYYFDPHAVDPNVLAYFAAGAITNKPERLAVINAISALKSARLYQRMPVIGLCSPTSQAAGLLNFVGLVSATNVNSSTFSVNGFTFNGTTQRLNLNYAMGSGSLTEDSVSMGLYLRVPPPSGTTKCLLGVNAGTGLSPYKLSVTAAATQTVQGLLGSATSGISVGSAYGVSPNYQSFLFSVSKVNDTDVRLYSDGVQIGASVASSTGTLSATLSLFLGCANNNGTAGSFSATNICSWYVGNGFSPSEIATIANIFDTYNSALGRVVIPA